MHFGPLTPPDGHIHLNLSPMLWTQQVDFSTRSIVGVGDAKLLVFPFVIILFPHIHTLYDVSCLCFAQDIDCLVDF